MSFSEEDRSFRPGARTRFPLDPSADTEAAFATVIADALRHDFGSVPARVKHIARLTGTNPRTVKNWLQAQNGPSGAGLVVLMRHSDAVTEAVLALADRQDHRKLVEGLRLQRELRRLAQALLEHLGPE